MPNPLMPGDELAAPDGVVARMIRTTAGSTPAALEVEWTVPPDTMHVHPSNAGDEPLVARQTIAPDPPEPELTGGVERYFETFFALAQRGGVDRFGRVKDPLQDAISIWENLVPGSYIAGIPTSVQRPLLRAGAALAARRGRVGWVAAERRVSASSGP